MSCRSLLKRPLCLRLSAGLLTVLLTVAHWQVSVAAENKETIALSESYSGQYSLDPHEKFKVDSIDLMDFLFQGLFKYDNQQKLVPLLAKEYTRLDKNRWLITLRNDVQFHQNSHFTVRDVIYTMDRIRNQKIASPYGTLVTNIANYYATNKYQLVIVTQSPDPYLMHRLQPIKIIRHDENGKFHNTASINANAIADGTGPYQLIDRNADGTIVLQKYNSAS